MMKDIFKPVIVLASICLAVTMLLAFVNELTLPVIVKAEEAAAAAARSEVLKNAKSFEAVTVSDLPEGVTEIYKGDNGSGYVVLTQSKGYGGTVRLICGIHTDGTIETVKILSHSETSGVGTKAVDNNSGYRDIFIGISKNTVEQVDTVTGATISSKAVKTGVSSALQAYELIKEAGA